MPWPLQDVFIERGEKFALKNIAYLLMTIAAFQRGKITPGKMFLENKAILVSPGGKILNVFHKNHPVPFVERSVPGDGKIPAIATSYGIMSTSIYYDADMPWGMRNWHRTNLMCCYCLPVISMTLHLITVIWPCFAALKMAAL